MRGLAVAVTLLVGGIVARAGAEQPVARGCEKIAAAMDQAGGGLSADEIAKKTDTDVETVRGCMDAWNASHKDAKGVPAGTGQAVSRGCAKVVGVLEQQPGLSAEEIALKTMTNVQTVRGCTDQWRQMKRGAKP